VLRTALFTSLFLARAAPAFADPPLVTGVRLSWARLQDADTCPDQDHIFAEVQQRVGNSPFEGPTTLSIEAVVSREQNEWRTTLYVRDGTGTLLGTRELRDASPSCEPIASAASVMIALAINPDLSQAPTPPVVATAPVVAPVRVRVVYRTVPPTPPSPWRSVFVSARLTVAADALPGIVIGAGIHADGTITQRLRWMIGGYSFTPAKLSFDSSIASVSLTVAELGVCIAALRARYFWVDGCASVVAGALLVNLVDVPNPSGIDRFWSAGRLGVQARVPLYGDLFAEAGADVSMAFVRYHYATTFNDQTMFKQPFLGLFSWIGLGVTFR
jgi:hypothetical protein